MALAPIGSFGFIGFWVFSGFGLRLNRGHTDSDGRTSGNPDQILDPDLALNNPKPKALNPKPLNL